MRTVCVKRLAALVIVAGLLAQLTACGGQDAVSIDQWEYIPASQFEAGMEGFNPEYIAAMGQGFIALAQPDGGDRIDSWNSVDGVHWRKGGTITAPPGGRFWLSGLIPWHGGVLALAVLLKGEELIGQLTWISRDGLAWEQGFPVPIDPGAVFRAPTLALHGKTAAVVTNGSRLWLADPGEQWRRVDPVLPSECWYESTVSADTPLGVVLLGVCPGHPEGSVSPNAALVMDHDGTARELTEGLPLFYIGAVAAKGSTILIAGAVPDRQSDPILGQLPPADEGYSVPVESVLYRSADSGRTWSSQHLPLADGQNLGHVSGLVVLDDTSFAAAGWVHDIAASVLLPTIWTTTDGGHSWQNHFLPALGENLELGPMATAQGKTVIVVKAGYSPHDKTIGLIVNAP